MTNVIQFSFTNDEFTIHFSWNKIIKKYFFVSFVAVDTTELPYTHLSSPSPPMLKHSPNHMSPHPNISSPHHQSHLTSLTNSTNPNNASDGPGATSNGGSSSVAATMSAGHKALLHGILSGNHGAAALAGHHAHQHALLTAHRTSVYTTNNTGEYCCMHCCVILRNKGKLHFPGSRKHRIFV